VGRPRKVSVKLPPHVHAVKARGKRYYYFQRFRGTEREEPRIKLSGEPQDRDGMPNPEWWRAYRELRANWKLDRSVGPSPLLSPLTRKVPNGANFRATRDHNGNGI
jgi:hypothetical protein